MDVRLSGTIVTVAFLSWPCIGSHAPSLDRFHSDLWVDCRRRLFCLFVWTLCQCFLQTSTVNLQGRLRGKCAAFSSYFPLFRRSKIVFHFTQPEGAPQDIDFSSNIEIFAYVPEVKRGGQSLPFLCCDVDDFDESMISWTDRNPYDYHNLIFDVPHKSLRREQFSVTDDDAAFDNQEMFGFHRSRYPGVVRKELDYANSIYSLVRHYPTKWQLNMAKEDGINFDD